MIPRVLPRHEILAAVAVAVAVAVATGTAHLFLVDGLAAPGDPLRLPTRACRSPASAPPTAAGAPPAWPAHGNADAGAGPPG